MKSLFLHFIPLLCCIWRSSCCLALADSSGSSVQDICPTKQYSSQAAALLFMNGLPCKNPASVIASDFKSSKLNHAGDTDNFLKSWMDVVTASDFPGINTLGISFGRSDLDVDGMILPHYHPRASELLYVSRGTVVAAFIDTGDHLFQKKLVEGDVFTFPRGLLHFCLNAGGEHATMFSVLNSQNPGVVSVAPAMFGSAIHNHKILMMKKVVLSRINLISLSTMEEEIDLLLSIPPSGN